MAHKDKEKTKEYQRKYYLEKKKPKYVPHPRKLLTREEKLAKKRDWYHKNVEKNREVARRSYLKNKDKVDQRNKIWRESHKDYLKEYFKQRGSKWHHANKERASENGKIWRQNNPDKVKEKSRRFAKENPEKVKAYLEKYNQKIQARYRLVKSGAKKRNYIFELSLEEYVTIVHQDCKYCGENEKKIGIDRVDNTIGYTTGNSVPCCKNCNMMKKDLTVKDFLEHIHKIANHSK